MAFDPNELLSTAAGVGSGLRTNPANDGVRRATLAGGTGTLAPLTAVAYNTSTNLWVVFDADGSNGTDTIRGFIWPDEAILVSGSETLTNILMFGTVHYDDIPLVSGEYNQAELLADLQLNARGLGLIIDGMPDFR